MEGDGGGVEGGSINLYPSISSPRLSDSGDFQGRESQRGTGQIVVRGGFHQLTRKHADNT